ncbi:MAG: hypothetical protein V1767_02635 [Chloroflexota bacterium]
MNKLLGFLPYLYFFGEPICLGSISLLSVPDTQGREFTPKDETDKKYLRELIKCFPVSRGLVSAKGVLRSFTYFLADSSGKSDAQLYTEVKNAITLLRYMMLRPDNQGLNDLETSSVYTFEIPPAKYHDTRSYHGLVNFNQEEWVTPAKYKFYPPGWHVDCQFKHTSILEGLESINDRFKVLDERTEADIMLAMEWYNLSFSKYTLSPLAGQLVDIATAFETLLRLPRNNKKQEFKKRIRELLKSEENSILDDWAESFYGDVRSETVHAGKPLSYVFKHPDAQAPHLSFLWSAQRIFRECIAAKTGMERKLENDYLIEELTPNDVILKKLKALGSYKKIISQGESELWKLRQRYPVGEKEDIIWLGNVLLREISKQLPKTDLPSLAIIVDSILESSPDDNILWSKYVQLDKELSDILCRGDIQKAKHLSQCLMLAYDVSRFAGFAWYALQILTVEKKRNSMDFKK